MINIYTINKESKKILDYLYHISNTNTFIENINSSTFFSDEHQRYMLHDLYECSQLPSGTYINYSDNDLYLLVDVNKNYLTIGASVAVTEGIFSIKQRIFTYTIELQEWKTAADSSFKFASLSPFFGGDSLNTINNSIKQIEPILYDTTIQFINNVFRIGDD